MQACFGVSFARVGRRVGRRPRKIVVDFVHSRWLLALCEVVAMDEIMDGRFVLVAMESARRLMCGDGSDEWDEKCREYIQRRTESEMDVAARLAARDAKKAVIGAAKEVRDAKRDAKKAVIGAVKEARLSASYAKHSVREAAKEEHREAKRQRSRQFVAAEKRAAKQAGREAKNTAKQAARLARIAAYIERQAALDAKWEAKQALKYARKSGSTLGVAKELDLVAGTGRIYREAFRAAEKAKKAEDSKTRTGVSKRRLAAARVKSAAARREAAMRSLSPEFREYLEARRGTCAPVGRAARISDFAEYDRRAMDERAAQVGRPGRAALIRFMGAEREGGWK
jgi:hypothetical protein